LRSWIAGVTNTSHRAGDPLQISRVKKENTGWQRRLAFERRESALATSSFDQPLETTASPKIEGEFDEEFHGVKLFVEYRCAIESESIA